MFEADPQTTVTSAKEVYTGSWLGFLFREKRLVIGFVCPILKHLCDDWIFRSLGASGVFSGGWRWTA